MESLKKANEPTSETVELPVYDKSRFGGQGDRSDETVVVKGPLDVVVFEGWMTGFVSLSEEELTRKYQEAHADPTAYGRRYLDYDRPTFLGHRLQDLLYINQELKRYEEGLWSYLDCFVQIKPEEMNYVWDWRLQVSAPSS